MLVLTTAQMKEVERQADLCGVSYETLMENAGEVSFNYLKMRYQIESKNTLIICGSGNNGGDGFVLARKISENGGKAVVAMACGSPKSPLAIMNFGKLSETNVGIIDITSDTELAREYIGKSQIIVDAVFGTGFHGEAETNVSEIFSMINDSDKIKVSLDVPSGINADSGKSGEHCINADITLAFGSLKPVHTNMLSKISCGVTEVLDIGIPYEVIIKVLNNVIPITKEMVGALLPKRAKESHKGNYGRLLNISGSINMTGAAMMSTLAAMRCGAGLTTLATTRSVANRVAAHIMEAMTLSLPETVEGSIAASAGKALDKVLPEATGILLGCGLSQTSDTKRIVDLVLKNTYCNIVLDADALNCISDDLDMLGDLRVTPIITPHIGEMARLCSMTVEQVKESAKDVAKLFAKDNNVIVVLKSHKTIIATPTGELYENETGNPCLAKGGSGDVLAGIIASFVAQGFEPQNAAIIGVYLHGTAADMLAEEMSEYSVLARDLIDKLPFALKELCR